MQENRPHILIYDDSPVFGGHECMALKGLEAILLENAFRVTFVYSQVNKTLKENLNNLRERGLLKKKSFLALEIPFATRRFQGIWNRFERNEILFLSELIREKNPNVILVIQGDIEISSRILMVPKQGNYKQITYIPMAHSLEEMGAKCGKWRDRLNRYLFEKPDGFITISQDVKKSLEKYTKDKKIEVVHNGIHLETFPLLNRSGARHELDIPDGVKVIGTLGRIEFNQKGHDFLLQSLTQYRGLFSDCYWLVVGDGPDRDRLMRQLESSSWKSQFKCIPWSKNTNPIYTALDVLAIPSRYEGVPLVMLEAMYKNLPIAASDRDGMQAMLPRNWLFEYKNCKSCAQCIHGLLFHASREDRDRIAQNRTKVEIEFNESAFQKNFVNAMRSFLL